MIATHRQEETPMTGSSYGKTSDGYEISEGLAVYTNEVRVGLVRLGRERSSNDGWFDVEYSDGRMVMQNGERVAVKFRGLDGKLCVAADDYELPNG